MYVALLLYLVVLHSVMSILGHNTLKAFLVLQSSTALMSHVKMYAIQILASHDAMFHHPTYHCYHVYNRYTHDNNDTVTMNVCNRLFFQHVQATPIYTIRLCSCIIVPMHTYELNTQSF